MTEKELKNYNICLENIKMYKAIILKKQDSESSLYLGYYLGRIDGYLQTIYYYNEQEYHKIEQDILTISNKIFERG
jgi:hypothetical protein